MVCVQNYVMYTMSDGRWRSPCLDAQKECQGLGVGSNPHHEWDRARKREREGKRKERKEKGKGKGKGHEKRRGIPSG